MSNANTETVSASAITYPTADQLDTGDYADGVELDLYLVPAAECDDGRPRVTTAQRIGAGVPAPAWHRRWRKIASITRGAVGESVLEALEACEAELLALSATYQGSYWDGRNTVGQWHEVAEDAGFALDAHWDNAAYEIQYSDEDEA